MEGLELTEKDICKWIDSICDKLDGGILEKAYKADDTISGKLKILDYIVENNIIKYDRTKEMEYLNNQIRHLKCELNDIKARAVSLEREKKALEEENCNQQWEIKKQSEIIEEQRRVTEHIQKELERHMAPKTMKGNKHAYKKSVDPERVFRDIENGMSKAEAAEKYNVSRETIRNRYKEYKQKRQ